MRVVKFAGNKKIFLEEIPKPVPEKSDVVIKVKAVALCGTDLPRYAARPEKTLTCVPGHEIAGQVVEVDSPLHLKVEDRIALSTQVGCGFCDACRKGEVLFCQNSRIFGTTPGFYGGYAEYMRAPESACLPLPDDLSYEVGSMMPDFVGVPYHAVVRIGGVQSHELVVVFGAGPIGLGMILLLKYLGARVIATEINEYRINLAKRAGADYVLNPQKINLTSTIREISGGKGVDKCFDCAANTEETVTQALDCVRRDGKVVLIGQKEKATFNPNWHVIWRQSQIIGSCAFNLGEWGQMVNIVQNGLKVQDLITHRFPLEKAAEAFRVFDEGNTGKVVIVQNS